MLLCQFAYNTGGKNTDMLVMQMIMSTEPCKTFGLLNSSLAQSQGQGPKSFFKKTFYCCFHHTSWPEVISPIAEVINTQIFLLLSRISQLLLNQSPCPAFHISCAACKIIPKFPFTVLGLFHCSVWKSIRTDRRGMKNLREIDQVFVRKCLHVCLRSFYQIYHVFTCTQTAEKHAVYTDSLHRTTASSIPLSF